MKKLKSLQNTEERARNEGVTFDMESVVIECYQIMSLRVAKKLTFAHFERWFQFGCVKDHVDLKFFFFASTCCFIICLKGGKNNVNIFLDNRHPDNVFDLIQLQTCALQSYSLYMNNLTRKTVKKKVDVALHSSSVIIQV